MDDIMDGNLPSVVSKVSSDRVGVIKLQKMENPNHLVHA